MHPAASVILFTTASGAGYGLLALLGLLAPIGAVPSGSWFGFTALGLSLGLITLGLLSSTFHLGHRERAWRAMSQWRSSWLSREGVSALATYLPAGLFGIVWIFFGAVSGFLGVLAAIGGAVTVYCTGMIYRSLKPIRRWHNPLVVPVYLAFALMTGALWLNVLARLFGEGSSLLSLIVLLSIVLAWALKVRYWRAVDNATGESTPGTATGLGRFGEVRLLDPPHTQENYLMREMGFQVARKHSEKLRHLALGIGFFIPVVFAFMLVFVGGGYGAFLALVTAIGGSIGVVIERWLFFAEAKHTVTLYYGEQAA
ncbi:MAG: dimethyl sulfoxide reductase anchor subunit [Alphaproteobacteria bacterium]|nr:dimethyl sulfoxide reductase anchor subunit [Alphaproteobacteria bacterium]